MRRLTSPKYLFPILGTASALLYLGCSLYHGFIGFPLDDAWIHQTYARNLGLHGQLAYNLGEASVGSTSPLWSLLLTPPHLLRLDPEPWTYLLGAVLLVSTGWVTYRLSNHLFPGSRWAPLLTGAFCVLEWHLVWAAFSGMETLLFTFLALLVVERHLAGENPMRVGALSGLLTLARPEGLALLVLLVLDTFWRRTSGIRRFSWGHAPKSVSLLIVGFALPVVPYLALNLSVSGNLFPNTFYAKQAEYGRLLGAVPIWSRWARAAFAPAVGAQVLLLPGFCYAAYKAVSQRRATIALPMAWGLVLVTMYAWRLPVTYQHGRYLMPAIPILLIVGVWGTVNFPRLHRMLRQVLLISIPVLAVVFWLRGAEQYAADVRIINSELKAAGVWLQENTGRTAIVGAHDIGAIGYFSQRYLVDTAGLITPEVIPFMTDEGKVLRFLEREKVDYVAIFPSWYPIIAADEQLSPVYSSSARWIVDAGGDNVVIYKTEWAKSSSPA
jgi:hypothetical protein